MPKPSFKNSQMTIRLSAEVLESMKADAASLNISLADFVVGLYQDSKKRDSLEQRIKAIERYLFESKDTAA